MRSRIRAYGSSREGEGIKRTPAGCQRRQGAEGKESQAAERTLASVRNWIEKHLRLKVKEAKRHARMVNRSRTRLTLVLRWRDKKERERKLRGLGVKADCRMRKTARPVVWEGDGAQSPSLHPIPVS